jgi:hypothetical protein
MYKPFSVIITAVLLFSCSNDKPGVSPATGRSEGGSDVSGSALHPGHAVGAKHALELLPKEPTRSSAIQLISGGFDISGAKIEWLVNERTVASLAPNQLSGVAVRKGDTVQVRAFIQGSEVLSNVLQIVNAPPEIESVKLLPEVLRPGDTLSVEAVGSDSDGDDVTVLYEWTKNGEPAGRGQSIEGTVKRGDKIGVRITPHDGEASGRGVELNREIQNWPPVIHEHKEFSFNGSVYTYQVRASDADGDTLSYALASPVQDMKIDASTGLVTWNIPPDFEGKKTIAIVVNDGHGGIATYSLDIAIR